MELEAVRGIAAVIVYFHHYLLFFLPAVHGRYLTAPYSLVKTPLFALVNGSASVTLFFVLSGFVLTFSALKKRDLNPLATSAVRRWPRLCLPVFVVSIAAGLLAVGGFYSTAEAARLSGSNLLTLFYRTADLHPYPLLLAAKEGFYGTFLFGTHAFNNNLWTMTVELFGSFAVFAAAALAILFHRAAPLLIAVFGVVLFVVWPDMAPMLAGTLIAYGWANGVRLGLAERRVLLLAAIGLAIVCYGYDGYSVPRGFYAFLQPVYGYRMRIVIHTVAAVLIMCLVLDVAAMRRALQGRFAAFLGRQSFPLYLAHLPIMCTFSTWAFIRLTPWYGPVWAALVVLLPTTLLTLLASWLLGFLEAWWLRQLRRISLRPFAAPAMTG